ncbi:MAG: hypothetical protein ACRERD_18865, partial [Candidatus Binatia bacterium]
MLALGVGLMVAACATQGGRQQALRIDLRSQRADTGIQRVAEPHTATTAKVETAYGNLPLHFEANQGQPDQQVNFLSRGSVAYVTGFSQSTAFPTVNALPGTCDGDADVLGVQIAAETATASPPLQFRRAYSLGRASHIDDLGLIDGKRHLVIQD